MVLGPLGIEEVVAADFRLALKGPVHATRSLFSRAGFHGTSKWKMSAQ